MTPDQLTNAIATLAACDHFDESRRAARTLPHNIQIVDLLRAADGATQLARHINENRRAAP